MKGKYLHNMRVLCWHHGWQNLSLVMMLATPFVGAVAGFSAFTGSVRVDGAIVSRTNVCVALQVRRETLLLCSQMT
jgi:hypothetical protein